MTRGGATLALAAFAAAMLTAAGMRTGPAAAQARADGRADVAIMGARQLAHAATDPLLLRVHIFNGEAQQAAAQNVRHARLAADAAASTRFQQLGAAERARLLQPYVQQPVPAIQLGAPDRALAAFLRFTTEDSQGAAVPLVVRPLASTAGRLGIARLDERRSAMLAFGVDAAALAAIPAGTYAIRAHVDTEAERGMWRGRTTSRPIVITLGAVPANETARVRLARLARAGEFHLADEQFVRAEATARAIIAIDDAAVAGWVLLGDALDGGGRPRDALDAFLKALALENARPPASDGADEPPVYIQDRIVQIQAALQAR
jgi:hypothetical protein